MTVIGVQVMPTRAFTSLTTMPRRPRSLLAAAEPAVWTLSQHWREPVAQEPAGIVAVDAGGLTEMVVAGVETDRLVVVVTGLLVVVGVG